jgi:hypothetical protein
MDGAVEAMQEAVEFIKTNQRKKTFLRSKTDRAPE